MASDGPIINRFLRLRKEVLDPLQPGLTFEGLVDALLVLYDHCGSQDLKNQHQAVGEFISKYQTQVHKYNKMRIGIKDFDLKRIIGRGNFADVKLAKEKSSGKVYAMKIMKKNSNKNSAFYEEERDIMARTSSPWLTKLDYAFQDHKNLYLAMEFHAGGDLVTLLDKLGGKLEEPVIRFYTAEVALGIHDLHKMGYVHRDIKPENILLDITGHVKIADFGSAAQLNSSGLITKSIPVGTPEYIAPEVLQCHQQEKGSHGPECDYWSLGILAYEMRYGTTPFSDLDGSVINTYANIMSYKKVDFPEDPIATANLKNLISKLLKPASQRIQHKQIVRHAFFGDLDWANMKNHIPPHVPQVKGSDDASNFDLIEEEPSTVDTTKLKEKNNYSNLPFIGFTFTSDKGKLKSLESKESTSLEHELKAKASELENYKLRIFQLEQQVFNHTSTTESHQREFEVTEKLTKDLAMAENDNTQLKTNIKNLERMIEIERQERSATEHKTLQVLADVRKKWAKSEEEKLEKLRTQLKAEEDKNSDLESALNRTKRELKSTKSELESVKVVKGQLKNKLKDYKQRLENVASLEEKRSETVTKLESENAKLKDVVAETSAAINESKTVEGKVDALQLIIEQRDQILGEKDAEIKIKSVELEFALKKTAEDKKHITELENKFKRTQVDLKTLQKDVEELHNEKTEMDQSNDTVSHMKQELTDAISEISSLTDQLEGSKKKESAVATELAALKAEYEKRKSAQEKTLQKVEKEQEKKEENYKQKIKDLEKVFDKLQARIDELQAARKEEIKEKSRAEVVDMESKLHNMERQLEKAKRKIDNAEEERKRVEKDNANLKERVGECEQTISEVEKEKTRLEQTVSEEKQKAEDDTELTHKTLALEKEVRELKLDLRIEKKEVEKKSNLLTFVREREHKTKDKLTEAEGKLTELETELNTLKGEKEGWQAEKEALEKTRERVEKQREEMNKIKQEKLDINMEKRRIETEVNVLERKVNKLQSEIDGFSEQKEKWKSIQINNDALKGLSEELDRQVTDFEAENEALEGKVDQLEAEIRDLTAKIDSSQEETRKAKIDINEQKSAKLFTERKMKDLELKVADLEKENTKEKEVFEKNMSEYRDLCNKLSASLETLTAKHDMLEQNGKGLSKVKSHLEQENSLLKVELTEKTTQLASHKESNFKLTQGIEEAIAKIQEKNTKVEDLELRIETEARVMNEQVTRHEGTIAQQTKLIDFLQQKNGELEGRKKTFADKLFGGNKENRPDNHMVVGYQDIQTQLAAEKSKNRKLHDQLSRVRSEVVALKTSTLDSQSVPRSVLNQIDDNTTASHNIPHRLHQAPNKKSVKCPVCQETIGFMMLANICKDCGVAVHNGCADSLPPTCGLSSQLVSALQEQGPRGRSNSEAGGRARSQSRSKSSMKDRPLPIPPHNTDKEGQAQILLRGEWTEAFIVLTLDNILDIYEDSSRNIRIDQISLTAPHCRVSVQSSVTYTEVYYVRATDRPYTFKLTVHTEGKPEKAVYLMSNNFAQKVEWVNRLEEVIKTVPTNLQPVPDSCQADARELIAAVPVDTEILAMDTMDDMVVMGTNKGLMTRDMSDEDGQVRSLQGLDVPVHKVVFIRSIQSFVLATGADAETDGQLVTVCARSVHAGAKLQPENIPEITHCHIFAAYQTNKGQVYLCAANKHNVSIFEWSPKRAEFCLRNKFSTDKPTGCIYFTDTSVLVGTTKFYEIDLKMFSAEEFLDTCDPGIKKITNSYEFEGSEPRDVLTLSNNASDPQYILCYTRHLLFVDQYGQQVREPIAFSKLPLENKLVGRALTTSFSDRIHIHNLDKDVTEKIEMFTPQPHLVGINGTKIFFTTPGEAAYHLVSLDLSRVKHHS